MHTKKTYSTCPEGLLWCIGEMPKFPIKAIVHNKGRTEILSMMEIIPFLISDTHLCMTNV